MEIPFSLKRRCISRLKWHLYVMFLHTSFLGLTSLTQPTPKPTAAAPCHKPSVEVVDESDNEDNKDSCEPKNKPLSSKIPHILEQADGSDNADDDSGDKDMAASATADGSEEWVESTEEELSKCSHYIQTMVDLHDIRAPLEGLELVHLRILQANSIH